MGKRIFLMILCTLGLQIFTGCSMMPEDEEIIKGSVMENEIFGNELDDEVVENIDIEDEIENINAENEDDNNVEEDIDESIEVEVQSVE